MPTRRGKDLRVRYDTDAGAERIVAQRTYRDQDDILLTPITPKLQARVVTGVPVDRSRMKPRHSICCLPNPDNLQGHSDMKVFIPYLPASSDHREHLLELVDYSNERYECKSVNYYSEGLE